MWYTKRKTQKDIIINCKIILEIENEERYSDSKFNI